MKRKSNDKNPPEVKPISEIKNVAKKEIKVERTKNEQKEFKISSLLIPLIASLLTFGLTYIFTFPNIETLILYSVLKAELIFILSTLSLLVFYGFFINDKISRTIIKTSFFLILLSTIAFGFLPIEKEENQTYIDLYFKLEIYINILIIPGIALGICAVLSSIKIKKSEEVIEKEPEQEQIKPHFIKSYFSKKELPFTIVWLVLVSITSFTLLYKLDYFDLYSDEAQVIESAVGYYHTGKFIKWDFVKDRLQDRINQRAWTHLWLLAQTYKILGISPWNGRFLSVLFGIFAALSIYPITRFFTNNKIIALLAILPFAFFYDYLVLLRWTRMYALLIPVYSVFLYLSYRMITENNTLKFPNLDKIPKIKPYIDFNFRLLPSIIFLAFFSYTLHYNSLFIYISIFVFSVVMYLYQKDKKYLTIIFLSILFTTILLSIPFFRNNLRFFTFFEQTNQHRYTEFIGNYPISWKVNIILLITGTVGVFLSKNKESIIKIIFLLVNTIILWLMFSFVFDYEAAFRYISFAAIFSIILILTAWQKVLKLLLNRYANLFLIIIVIVSTGIHFERIYHKIYVVNNISVAKPSIAFKTIEKLHKKNQLIYRHWAPMYYLDKLDTTIDVKVINNIFAEAIKEMQKYESGWLTWKSQNYKHMNDTLMDYARLYFKKYNGRGIDSTWVELYYFEKNMFKTYEQFEKDRQLPFANLNLNRDLTICFTLGVKDNCSMTPFYAYNETDTILFFEQNPEKKSSYCVYRNDTIFYDKNSILFEGTHHVFLDISKKNKSIKIYLDGKLSAEKRTDMPEKELVKLRVNQDFYCDLNDLRIYDFELNEQQRQKVLENIGIQGSDKLFCGDKKFETLHFWYHKEN